jgi:uncharacterized protein YbjT (DUF2867 family)
MPIMADKRVLVLGATGVIGRPVTEQLAGAGFSVRAMVRDMPRAAAMLDFECELVSGDLRDEDSVERAVAGIDAVYLSLSEPMSAGPPAWNPDSDGARTVAAVMQRVGVRRLARISAMGVEHDENWWVAKSKKRVDQFLLESGLDVTIFRPTWFMESIPMSSVGPFLIRPTTPNDPLYWLAAEDYGRKVAAALRDDSTIGQIIECQGPEGVSMKEAYKRFQNVWRTSVVTMPVPRVMLKLMGNAVGPTAYLDALLDMTYNHVIRKPAETNGHALYRPTITIEQFAQKLLRSRWLPRKKL